MNFTINNLVFLVAIVIFVVRIVAAFRPKNKARAAPAYPQADEDDEEDEDDEVYVKRLADEAEEGYSPRQQGVPAMAESFPPAAAEAAGEPFLPEAAGVRGTGRAGAGRKRLAGLSPLKQALVWREVLGPPCALTE